MAWFPLHLIPHGTKIRFVRFRNLAFVLSALMIIGSIGLIATKGLNLGIDFTGGVLIELRTETEADLGQMRNLLSDKKFGEVSLQNFGDAREVLIRIQANDENQSEIVAGAKAALDNAIENIDYRRVEYVGPTVGQELVRAGFTALGLSLLGMMLYVWFRFEWQYGIGGIIALMHDAIILLGFYAFMGLDFGLSAIAAILTVIGYSINDSVVIYDRIRENLRKFKKMPIDDLLNLSINETLSRTVLTGGTTLLALITLALWGGEIIRGFALAIGFGVVIGTYSSIYIAAPVLSIMHVRNSEDGVNDAKPAGKNKASGEPA
ncbi:MAG: protein translocase subunit SecF [Alphaproteobacteria bacterium]|nr:protein translocase subunit SecF [Alphaproteobacteria bacterium]